jgi:hypothetical protein
MISAARFLTAVALAFAAGCVSPSREDVLEPLVGQDIDTAIEAFGPPADTVELEDGRRVYAWRRVYHYDKGRRARSWPERRTAGWTDDPERPADGRVCATRLTVGFDLRIEAWTYGCETVIVDRAAAPGGTDSRER